MRIALYWHNGRSLGHTAESAKIAHALVRDLPGASLAGISGAYRGLDMLPAELDLVKLPAFVNFDRPHGWDLAGRQGFDKAQLFRVRAELAEVFLRHYAPDVLLVNHEPRGLYREMVPALTGSRSGVRILTLRGVLSDRAKTNAEYFEGEAGRWLAEHFDAIFVHCDPQVFRLEEAYDIPEELRGRIRHLGYLTEPSGEDRGAARRRLGVDPGARLVVATMGGGQGALPIWRAVLAALDASRDELSEAYLVTGPYLEPEDRARLETLVADRPWARLAFYEPDLRAWMAAADLVLGAAGSNMLSEVLAAGANAVVIPRQVRESEQLIHSRLLADRGLVRACTLEGVEAGDLVGLVAEGLRHPLRPGTDVVMGGCRRYADEIRRVLEVAGRG